MSPVYGIRVAINGSETDPVDSVSWLSKIAKVKITGGGGDWFKPGLPFTCTFDLTIKAGRAHQINTIAVAVSGPNRLGGSRKAWMTTDGTDREYVVVFSGTVTSLSGKVGQGLVSFRAFDDLQGHLSRAVKRGGFGATSYSTPRNILTALDAAIGLSASGDPQFPDGTTDTGQVKNVPVVEQQDTFGGIVDTGMAGTGVNLTCDWNGPITAPVMRYRPDFYYLPDSTATITRTRQREVSIYRPWLFAYEDYGLNFADFPSRITLDGTNASGTDIYGWARLSAATKRNLLGNREVKIQTWGQTQAELRDAADNLLGRTGDPEWVRQVRTIIPLEHVYRGHADLIATEGTAPDWTESLFDLACVMLGDTLTSFAPVESSWPVSAQGDCYDELSALWDITIQDNSDTRSTSTHVIKNVTREWTPTGGWILEVGMWPVPASPIYSASGDKGSGTY